MAKIYIVEADCDDQNQHICDWVVARSREAAKEKVLKVRPYLDECSVTVNTQAEEVRELRRQADRLERMTPKQVEKDWQAILVDDGLPDDEGGGKYIP